MLFSVVFSGGNSFPGAVRVILSFCSQPVVSSDFIRTQSRRDSIILTTVPRRRRASFCPEAIDGRERSSAVDEVTMALVLLYTPSFSKMQAPRAAAKITAQPPTKTMHLLRLNLRGKLELFPPPPKPAPLRTAIRPGAATDSRQPAFQRGFRLYRLPG